jgi:phosphoribosylcarboxyaminoimidazole (NCAIR) mutase
MNRALAKNQPLIVQHRFLNAWKRLVGLGYVGRLISCKRDKRLFRGAVSVWRAQTILSRRVSAMQRRRVGLRALKAWFFAAYCSSVVATKVRVRAEAYAYCSFNRMKTYARARLDMVFSLRSLALCRSLRRLFLAWDEAVVEGSLQRYQELVPLKAQLDRAQKRLGDSEVRAATLQRDRDSFKQILGRSEEKNKQLEANEVRLQERLARTQEKLVQTENLRAKAMTRAQQAEARAAKLLAGAGGSAAAPVAAGGSAAAPVAAGFVSTDSLVDCVQCPITMQIPVDPVTAEDNFTYDRAAIEDHFRRRGAVSPMTNEPLASTRLKTCAFARQVISALFPGHRLAPAGN